jgi:hypothetical protein
MDLPEHRTPSRPDEIRKLVQQLARQNSRPHRRLALDGIRDKTGCRRRADLTRLALQAAWSNWPVSPARAHGPARFRLWVVQPTTKRVIRPLPGRYPGQRACT